MIAERAIDSADDSVTEPVKKPRMDPVDLLDLVGEVTSSNHETDTGPKYRTYAAAGVPVHVLIHRDEKKAFACSDPKPGDASAKARYATKVEVDLGRSLPLPEPYPALDTSVFLAG
ncbi:Uma2 family endonuclease [Streptomyces xiamenensis]|nr:MULTISPECIES: Uma2 family endonuclease [Streptomyces]